MTLENPHRDDERTRDVLDYVNRFANAYYDSQEFAKYKQKTSTIKYAIDQEWEPGTIKSKYRFKFAVARGANDNIINSVEDLTDVENWVIIHPLQSGKEIKKMADDMEDFANNLLYKIKFGEYFNDRFAYIPAYGWSIAYDEFLYSEGYRIKPKVDSQSVNGITWDKLADTLCNEPRGKIIHPYNWFGELNKPVWKQSNQGYVCKWYARDVVQAMAKVDGEGRPLYNKKALNNLLKMIETGKGELDIRYSDNPNRDSKYKEDIQNDNIENSVNVRFYIGTLNGAKGFYDDPNTYNVVYSNTLVLRFAEEPIDNVSPFNHMQTHPKTDCPIPRTPLDSMIPHNKINDTLINFGIENVIDSMMRFWSFNEEDYINPEAFKQPPGLNVILYMKNANVKPPQVSEYKTTSLESYERLNQMIERDRQRSTMGTTDLESGVQGKTADKTATATRAMYEALDKSTRAMIKRVIKRSVVPEIKYFIVLALQHFTSEQFRFVNRDGDEISITPELAINFMQNMTLKINDSITRNRALEAANLESFLTFAMQILPQLQSPATAIDLLRMFAREKGIKSVDLILDEPIKDPQAEGEAIGGQPGQDMLPAGQQQAIPPPQPGQMMPPPQTPQPGAMQ